MGGDVRRGRQLLCLILSAVLCPALCVGQKSSGTTGDASQKFTRAQQLLSEGDLAQARKVVLEGLALSPKSVEGYNLLGMLYTQEKDFVRSAAAFQHALNIDSHSAVTHDNLGNSYVAQNRPDLARKEYLTAVQLDPDNHDAYYNLGRLALGERHAQQAIEYFSHVQPPDVATSMSLVAAEFMAGRNQDAATLAAKISDQNTNDLRVHFSLGVLLGEQNLYPLAIHELEIADALQPGTFEILYNLGQAYYHSNKNFEAERAFQRALELKPESPTALYGLGKLYYTDGKDLQALQVLMRAHKIAPRNTDVIFLMARVSMVEKYYEDAVPLLKEGTTIDPKRADLHAALGDCYFTTGKTEEAIQEFQTLIDLAPTAGSYAFMGLCYRQLGRYDEARSYLVKGLEIDPHDPACLFNLGYIATRRGDLQEAENYLQAALKAKSDHEEAIFELAGVKMKQKKFEEALPLLRRCLELNPNRPETFYRLATTERALQQTEAAEHDFAIFETMSKNGLGGPYPFQHLFDFLDEKMGLAPQARAELDLAGLRMAVSKNPDRPRNLYLLAEAYLRVGNEEEAQKVVSHLDEVSKLDPRTALQVGVLLARYHVLADAIRHFQAALAAEPSSDDAKYDLANAYFEQQDYVNARAMLEQISRHGREDESYLALLGDLDARLGKFSEAQEVYRRLISKSPDNEAHYLSLALSQLGVGDLSGAGETLRAGLSRVPDSGRIEWGLGVLCVMDRQCQNAEQHFERALDLLPDWPSAYSALAVFYLSTGRVAKAREVFKRYQESFPRGPFDTKLIEQELAAADRQPQGLRAMTPQMQVQFLRLALILANQGPQLSSRGLP